MRYDRSVKTVRVDIDEALLARLDRHPEVRDRGRSAVLCEAVAEYLARREARTETSPKERLPLGQWLVENMPRGTNLPIPDRRDSGRPIPFIDYATEDEESFADAGAQGHDAGGVAWCRMPT